MAALRQLAIIGSVPVGTVRSLRLSPAIFDETKFAYLGRALSSSSIARNFVHFLELASTPIVFLNLFWELLQHSGHSPQSYLAGGSAD